jgi:hypothetical protein
MCRIPTTPIASHATMVSAQWPGRSAESKSGYAGVHRKRSFVMELIELLRGYHSHA